MTLDSEDQRAFLLRLIEQATFPGDVVEVACALKRAVTNADIRAAYRDGADMATRFGVPDHREGCTP